jgi:hypothetical protein
MGSKFTSLFIKKKVKKKFSTNSFYNLLTKKIPDFNAIVELENYFYCHFSFLLTRGGKVDSIGIVNFKAHFIIF